MPVQDYREFTAIADELIPEFGRDVVFRRRKVEPASSDTPWLVTDDWDDTDPPANHKVPVKAISVGAWNSEIDLAEIQRAVGTLISVQSNGFLVQGPAAIGVDLTQFSTMEDGGKVFAITKVAECKPGDTVIFYWVEVES
jgi:hypothetical protein